MRAARIVVVLVAAGVACRGERKLANGPVDTAAALPLPGAATVESLPPHTMPLESTTVAAAPPVVLTHADSAAGDVLYHRRGRCFTCHGGQGRGTAKLGPDLADSLWLNGDSSFAAIRSVIASGVATPRQFSVAMPAYAGTLSDSDLTHIAAYVYSLSHPGVLRSDSAATDTAQRADTVHVAGPPPAHDTTHSPTTP